MHPPPPTDTPQFSRKWLLRWVAVAVVVAAIGAGVWLVLYSDVIERVVRKELARGMQTDWQIEGIHIRLWDEFPRVSAVLEGVYVAGSGSAGDTLLRAEEVALAFDAWGLLQGRYVLEELTLEGAEVRLRKDADGRWNTDVWRTDSAATTTPWTLEDLRLSAVRLDVDGTVVDLREVRAEGALSEAGVVAEVSGAFRPVAAWWDPEAEDFEGQTSVQYRWTDGHLTADIEELALGKAVLAGSLRWDNALQATCTFEEVSLDAVRAYLPLAEASRAWSSEVRAAGTATLHTDGRIELTASIPPTEVRWTRAEGKVLQGEAGGELRGTFSNDRFQMALTEGLLETEGLRWEGSATGNGTAWSLDGTAEEDFARWNREATADWIAPAALPTAGKATFRGSLAGTSAGWDVQGNWSCTDLDLSTADLPISCTATGEVAGETVRIATASIALGDLRIQGAGTVQGLAPDAPWVADVRLNLSPGDYGTLFAAGSTGSGGFLPPGCRVSLDVAGSRFTWGPLAGDRFRAECTITEQTVEVKRMTWDAWGGHTVVHGRVQPRGTGLQAEGSARWDRIELKPLFRAFDNFDQTLLRADHLSGSVSGTTTGTWAWNPDGSFDPASSAFDADVSLRGGALHRLEAFADMVAALREERLMAPLIDPDDLAHRLEHVVFEDLSTPFSFRGGTLAIPELDIATSAMDITVAGTSTWSGQVDYSIGFTLRDLRNTREDAIGAVADDGLGNRMFIRMAGPSDNPSYRWDREASKAHRQRAVEREKSEFRSLFRSRNQ